MDNFKSYLPHILLVIIVLTGWFAVADEELPTTDIVEMKDLSLLSQQARIEQKMIMLEISASYCSFCLKLEEEIIKPMLRSGDYDGNVLIRKMDIDSFAQLRDFDGKSVSSDNLARQWQIQVTPTLIFLNGQNQEVSERIIGVNSLDYFGSYVDNAIDNGLAAIR